MSCLGGSGTREGEGGHCTGSPPQRRRGDSNPRTSGARVSRGALCRRVPAPHGPEVPPPRRPLARRAGAGPNPRLADWLGAGSPTRPRGSARVRAGGGRGIKRSSTAPFPLGARRLESAASAPDPLRTRPASGPGSASGPASGMASAPGPGQSGAAPAPALQRGIVKMVRHGCAAPGTSVHPPPPPSPVPGVCNASPSRVCAAPCTRVQIPPSGVCSAEPHAPPPQPCSLAGGRTVLVPSPLPRGAGPVLPRAHVAGCSASAGAGRGCPLPRARRCTLAAGVLLLGWVQGCGGGSRYFAPWCW